MPSNENENVSTVNETIVTGKKYRVLKDKINGLWNRISFWTSANDVEFTDSGSLQGKRLNEVVTSIQNSAGVPGDSVVILDNNDAVPEGWELTTKPQDIVDLENAVDDLNDNLAQTPITVGGETLSTIDDKLNYLVEKSGGLFSMQLGGGASVITRFNLTDNGISIPTHTTLDASNSKDIFTIQGFSKLHYIWTVPYADRPIYLYVDNVLVDQLTAVSSSIVGNYTLADSGLHTVEFRTRCGYASYSCDFLY